MIHRGIWPVLVAAVASCTATKAAMRPGVAPSSDELLSALRARQEAVGALNLETRTTSWLGKERLRATVFMLVERSGRLRFEAEISLRGTVATLTTNGTTFALAEFEAGTYKTGPACPENVASLVRIPLLPAEIAAVLLGDAPLTNSQSAIDVEWDPATGSDVLVLADRDAPGRGALWVGFQRHGARWDVTSVEGRVEGPSDASGKRWRVRYEDLSVDHGTAFPGIIRFAEPGSDFDAGVEIKVKDRRLNPALSDATFRLGIPNHFRVITLDCETR